MELDFPDTDRTVFIMPPDSSGLPAGQEYRYEKFQDLKPDLFEDKSDSLHVDSKDSNVENNQNPSDYVFATPMSAAIAKRTKQEVKSAQKSARKML